MEKGKGLLYRLITTLLVIITVGLGQGVVQAEGNQEVDISVSPEDISFYIENAKPGDSITRTVTVNNDGRRPVVYSMKASVTSGAEALYKLLQMEVRDADTVLYTGSLYDLQNMPARKLAVKSSEKLTYKIVFPAEAGNEYQNLVVKGKIIFYAVEGETAATPGTGGTDGGSTTDGGGTTDSGPVSTDIGGLPDTSSGYMNYIAAGLLLVGASVLLFMKKRA